MRKPLVYLVLFAFILSACKRDKSNETVPQPNTYTFEYLAVNLGGVANQPYTGINLIPEIRVRFSQALNRNSAIDCIKLYDNQGKVMNSSLTFESGDSLVVLHPADSLLPFTKNYFVLTKYLVSVTGTSIKQPLSLTFITQQDTTDKFPRISDEELLDKVQSTTLNYFWKNGHPACGMARESNSSGDIVTTGGSGFGIMGMIAGCSRGFITRQETAERLLTITNFLYYKANRFHGVFPHWLNGNTGNVVPFSQKDNGADLVETAFLMQGLLCARQYFNQSNQTEDSLRSNIQKIWNEIEWTWFRKNNENVLYWHWSPNYGWAMNMQISGWNEALMIYVLAASSPTYPISKNVYINGFTRNGGYRNGNTYYGYKLPLGWSLGGPLFFAHYSFMGLNPHDLTDDYVNYWDQNVAHSKINYSYCVANPRKYFLYGPDCWGLTASVNDINGYSAHEPNNDLGIISPTAALSSMPYTPEESMRALRYFYYKLGNRLFGENGFYDAMDPNNLWFSDATLAIDQGPVIAMIENYRSGLLWNLFMSCPEVKSGLKSIGFNSPYIQ